jgi:predicted thioesterase
MKPSLQPGVSLTRKILIDRARTIDFMGEDARVYATPSMILDIERTCRDLILQHTDAGEDSVGIEVAIKHLAATLPGMTVEIDVRVTAVEGRKVTFEVTAKDQIEAISGGTHARFVVNVEKTVERLKAKAAKSAALSKS